MTYSSADAFFKIFNMTRQTELTDKQLAAIASKVKRWTGRSIGADAIRRVQGGDWHPSHPVERAILTALDEVCQ